jgi:hypothetical protein
MAIRISIEPGGAGQSAQGIPVVVCDACQDVIYRAAEGLWLWSTEGALASTKETADTTQTTTMLYTVHTDEVSGCYSMLLRMYRVDAEEMRSLPLETLPVFLGESTGVYWEQAWRQARRIAGQETEEE